MILFTPLECDCEGTEWRRWEAGVHPAPGPHLAYLPMERRRKSDKGQGFGCDKERAHVLLWPWISIVKGHPGARSWPPPMLHRYESDPVLADREQRGRRAETRGSGGVHDRFLPVVLYCRKAKLLPDLRLHLGLLQLASLPTSSFPSIHPPIFTCVVFSLPFSTLDPVCPYSGARGSRSCWAAWHRVTISVGKESLSRMPLSLWQSSSPMKPYQ